MIHLYQNSIGKIITDGVFNISLKRQNIIYSGLSEHRPILKDVLNGNLGQNLMKIDGKITG